MDFGLHLPLMDFGGNPFTLDHLITYAETGEQLGFSALAANDHLVYSKPWLDGPTALAAILSHSGRHGPGDHGIPADRARSGSPRQIVWVPSIAFRVAASLPALDLAPPRAITLRLVSHLRNAGNAWMRPFKLFVHLWNQEGAVFKGSFYNTEGIVLEPFPSQKYGPPIWVGSWGSRAGLQRVARLADGWLASGYNSTPELFAKVWQQLQEFLVAAGKEPSSFPNAMATMWLYITEDERDSERMLNEVLAPALNRPVAELRERLPIGSAQDCAEKLAAYQKVGVQRVYLWPLANELEQIKIFMKRSGTAD